MNISSKFLYKKKARAAFTHLPSLIIPHNKQCLFCLMTPTTARG